MQEYKTADIRNLVLLSHGGAGKTSLAEAMLSVSGATTRLGRVEDGNTVSDFDPDEVKRQISLNLSLVPFEWKNKKVNVLDPPGYADFVGEVKSAVRVADAALILVCAASGIEVGTEQSWTYCDEHELPRAVFVNRLDRDNADFFKVVGQLQAAYGRKCVPIELPIGAQSSFSGVVNLLTGKALVGTEGREASVPSGMETDIATYRDALIEAIAETDDALIAKYLDGEELSPDELQASLASGVANGEIVPILVGSATRVIGIVSLMDAVCEFLPSPLARAVEATNAVSGEKETLQAKPDAPLAALVFKTTADPFIGRLSYFRVYSGVVFSDRQLYNPLRRKTERIGQVMVVRGKEQQPAPHLMAGDIGAVAKLSDTLTGDTLCSQEHPVILQEVVFPEPVVSVAVHPKTKADLDKLGHALGRIAEEDPTLKVHREPDTSETLLSGMGETHLEVAAARMSRKFGVQVENSLPKVPYKETVTATTQAEYKHKKQTGGHGQYGHVLLRLEPQPRGSGFQFEEQVVGGSVPKNYIPAVEKGVVEALAEGTVAKFPVVDIKVVLYDGSFHAVDSSDMSFKIAAATAFKLGMEKATPVLLEPIMQVRVVVPEANMGDVIGDLNSRRARVHGTLPQDGFAAIEAEAPLAEMQRYATDLRSLTQGRGTYKMTFARYEVVPQHLTQQIAEAAHKAEKA